MKKQSKKYDFRTTQDKDTWNAEILRRASVEKTVVSKTQTGFKTEAEAKAWAEQELVLFTSKQSARNKRRAEKRS
ncbi:MAG: hypothetical protein ACJAZI_001594 [Cycloclasticus sp.]|jgi:hypothetical protein|tara:strand:+ start:176205 stop:176429 length:225 start_codon:yes stop_codon:yes gene_type:complete